MTTHAQAPTTSASLDADLLATHPRVRRDILYTEVPEGVLFHDATSGFRVHGRSAYRFATLVVPFLDGTTTVAELCSGLGDQQRGMVLSLVRSLYGHGFARAVPRADAHPVAGLDEAVRRRFQPQIAYVDHHVDQAETRFAAFRNTRVAIIGDDEVAGWLARSLLRNGAAVIAVAPRVLGDDLAREVEEVRRDGCRLDVRPDARLSRSPGWADLDAYHLAVVTPAGSGTRTLLDLLEDGVPGDRTLLPCWQLGDDVLVGPSMRQGTTGCWACAALRAGATAEAGAAADLWSGLAGHRASGHGPAGPVAAMVGNLLGYEIFRLTTGALPGETDGGVVIQDLDSLDVTVEPLLPHPACPLCRGTDGSWLGGTDLAEPSTSPQPDKPMPEPGSPETELQLAALEDRMLLVGSRLGPVTGFEDDLLTQTPLRVTTVHLALGHGRRRRIAAVDVHNVAGARTAALGRAAAVYADHVVWPAHLSQAVTVARAGGFPAVPPGALPTHTGLDPAGTTVSAWVRATSLTTGAEALVPAAAVAPWSDHNRARTFAATPAGTGVDDTPARARGAALLSALAHDALVANLRGRRTATRLHLGDGGDDPVLTFLVRTAGHLGVEMELLDLGGDLPAPVVLALTHEPGSGDPVWSVAADTSRRAATVTALRDVLGAVQLATALPAGAGPDLGDPVVVDLDLGSLAVSGAQSWAERAVTFDEVLDRLRADGVAAYALDHESADLAAAGLRLARVILARPDEH